MKNFDDMLEKAVSIADNDPNAFVCLIAKNIRQKLQLVENWIGDGVYKTVTERYVSNKGGQVKLVNYCEGIAMDLCGYQFTHVFADNDIDSKTKSFLKTRLRYKQEPFPEPSGFYTDLGIVERIGVW